jgi:hypothetical protein
MRVGTIIQVRNLMSTGRTIRRGHWCIRESVHLSIRRASFDSSAATKPIAETANMVSLSPHDAER